MMRRLSLLLIVVFLICAALLGSFLWDGFFVAPGPDAERITFAVEPGTSFEQIRDQLKEEGLVKSTFMFGLYTRISGAAGSLQAGTFQLSEGMSYAALIEALTQAESDEVQVTIPEGFVLAQIETAVREVLPHITDEAWQEAVGSTSPLKETHAELLGTIPEAQNLEGYLFPDTYRFHADATAQQVVETMVSTLERRLEENEVVLPEDGVMENGMTVHEVMTLASIVEREVRAPDEMRQVADIFLTRLEIGMALQADSTVNYFTGGDSPAISLTDRDRESPYNTYLNLGLPPGPISHPGAIAILSVLDPIETDYLYFLTTPEGEVIYSRTFNEHVANKNKYLK